MQPLLEPLVERDGIPAGRVMTHEVAERRQLAEAHRREARRGVEVQDHFLPEARRAVEPREQPAIAVVERISSALRRELELDAHLVAPFLLELPRGEGLTPLA